RILSTAPSDVAIFVDRGFVKPRKVLVPYLGTRHDQLALELANRIARNTEATVTVLHVVRPRGGDGAARGAKAAVERVFQEPGQPTPVTFRVLEDDSPVDAVLREANAGAFDLTLIGIGEEWGLESHLFGLRPERIAEECSSSLLIVRTHRTASPTPTPAPEVAPRAGV
ncbi:MAG: universal stress protein, partial [Tepidisphaeraceae bacterium]